MVEQTTDNKLGSFITRPSSMFVITLFVILGAFIRFYALDYAPPGGDGDSAWMAIDALDWLDEGAFAYYVDAIQQPATVVSALMATAIQVYGVSIETMRIVTGLTSFITVLLMLPTAWILFADDESDLRRFLIGLMAMGAAATSLHSMNMARLGVNTSILPMFISIALLATAYAWHYGGIWRWIIAGVGLALTQFIYISAHLMGVVAILWFLHSAIATHAQFLKRWRGWFIMAGTTLLVYLPNAILYLRWNEAFVRRLDASTHAEKLIWEHNFGANYSMWQFILDKYYNTAKHVGLAWKSPYLPLETPVLTTVFFVGWIIGLLVCLRYFKRTGYGWILLAPIALALADVLTSIDPTPSAVRQIGLTPFHYLIAGVGLAEVLVWIAKRIPQRIFNVGLVILSIVSIVPTVTGYSTYITDFIPDLYANPETAWRVNQTDIDISNRINANPDESYLLLYGEYTRKNIAWLTLQRFRERGSILADDGSLTLDNLPDNLTVIETTVPERARHTTTVGLNHRAWWVLLHDGKTYYLPPLSDAQLDTLNTATANVIPEELYDPSETLVANLHTIETPESLFALDDPTPVDATFSVDNQTPEVKLIGYHVEPSDPIAGEEFKVSLYWQPLQRMPRNYEIVVQLWEDNGTSHGNSHGFPFDGVYRTRIWQPDEIIVTNHTLFMTETLPTGRYRLQVALVRYLANENLQVTGSNAGQTAGWASIPDFRVMPNLDTDAQTISTPLDEAINLSDVLSLDDLAIALDGEQVEPFTQWTATQGSDLAISLEWTVLDRIYQDLSFFVHVTLQGENSPTTQFDSALGQLGLPSGAWRTGDQWDNFASLQLADNTPSGVYDVWVGVYNSADGERLRVQIDDDASTDRLQLGTIVIE